MRAPLATSYRRRFINAELSRHLFVGRVLDIGGGRRGWWCPPPPTCVTVDLSSPADVIADVQRLPFQEQSFDAVKATEVLEHVADTMAALRECRRVLRDHGELILSAPFMERIHADPHDYARYTDTMWTLLLAAAGFGVIRITAQGGYWTHLAEMLRVLVAGSPWGLRHLLCVTLPLLDVMARLDGIAGPSSAAYVGGWFIEARAV